MKSTLAIPLLLTVTLVATSANAQWNVLRHGQIVGAVEACGTPTPAPEPTPDPTPAPNPESASEPQAGDDVRNETVGGKVGAGVDLGLSVEWARWNLGADNERSHGAYFAWAETDGTKEVHEWERYKWIVSGRSDRTAVTKYQMADNLHDALWYDGTTFIGDGLTTIQAEDDAATVNWGGTWRMPTSAEVAELVNSCTWTWTSDYGGSGIGGYVVTGPNGSSIFMPAAGNVWGADIGSLNTVGNYWSSNLGTATHNAVSIEFNAARPKRLPLPPPLKHHVSPALIPSRAHS